MTTSLEETGLIVRPGDENWDAARHAWNLVADQHPYAVALPESAEDVVHAVRYARENGLRVAAQGTGHGAAPIASLRDTLLVKTSAMTEVEIDPVARRARVGAGAIWIDAVEAAAEHGLAALHGTSPDVGIVGYSLGGGMGWYARSHGLASNSVTAVEIVTPDGRLVRADHENEPELFWALRGGGGSFGVVTALEFELYPITEAYAGWLIFPIERSSEVLHAWREWLPLVPEEVTSVGRILNIPPLPEIPEPLRGRSVVVVEAADTRGEAAGAELLRPLRELGPEIDTFATLPAPALARLHMDPEDPVPGIGDGMLLRELPAEAVDAMVAIAGPGTHSPLLSVEMRHLGGELARRRPGNGALAAIDAGYVMFAVGMAMTPEMGRAVADHTEAVKHALAPYEADHAYFNFAELPADAEGLFDRETYHRLRAARAQYDPAEIMVSNHPIPAAR
jgi:FAD/FMN-containing dehydrogenase